MSQPSAQPSSERATQAELAQAESILKEELTLAVERAIDRVDAHPSHSVASELERYILRRAKLLQSTLRDRKS